MLDTPLSSAVDVLKALGHPTRLRIVSLLRDGPLSVCQIGAVLDTAPSTVSGHLLDLRRAGIVAERRQGKWVFYRLGAESGARAVLKAAFAALDGDTQVGEDRSIAGVLRAQSAGAACAATRPDRARRPPRRASADTITA